MNIQAENEIEGKTETEAPVVIEAEVKENTSTEVNDEAEDEVIVSIGDAAPPSDDEDISKAPEWVREVRNTNRELVKRNKELQEQLNQVAPNAQVPEVGAKPTLESCDYDADKFEAELFSWQERKTLVAQAEQARQAEAEKANAEWRKQQEVYDNRKVELKVKDFSDAEDIVKDTMSVVQQGIIVMGAENSALVVYALGKNPARAKELASIKDPVKFAFAVAKLEGQLKVSNKKAPPPERTVRSGSGAVSGAVDSQLERLREEAAKTGNYSKVVAYKKQLREKAH
jgi:hypothetical protein